MVILLLTTTIIALALAAYFYGEAQGLKTLVEYQRERINLMLEDLKFWQNKTLLRHGMSPQVEKEEAEKRTDTTRTPPSRVVTPSELRTRAAQAEVKATGAIQDPYIASPPMPVIPQPPQVTLPSEKQQEILKEVEAIKNNGN